MGFIGRAARAGQRFFEYYASHHVHSPQFAGQDTTNTTRRGRFGDSLAELDHSVGQLLQALAKNGVDANTLVLLTSDNGPSLRNQVRGGNAGLLRCGKGTTFEGGLRVPMIARWPGRIAPGAIRRSVMASIDILPTMLHLAVSGAAPPSAVGRVDPDFHTDTGAVGVSIGPRVDPGAVDGVAAVELLLGTGRSPRNDTCVLLCPISRFLLLFRSFFTAPLPYGSSPASYLVFGRCSRSESKSFRVYFIPSLPPRRWTS